MFEGVKCPHCGDGVKRVQECSFVQVSAAWSNKLEEHYSHSAKTDTFWGT
jgi:hypothetical protein